VNKIYIYGGITLDYISISKYEDNIPGGTRVSTIAVSFLIELEKPFAIGEKMNEINEEAYMNGYNWGAFFNYYLSKYAPDVLEGLIDDSEAGTYVAVYELTPDNEVKANKLVEIIRDLVENEDKLYRIIQEEGENIERED